MICRRDLGQAVQNGDLLGAADVLETQVFSPGGTSASSPALQRWGDALKT